MALFQIVPINFQHRLTRAILLPLLLMLALAGVLSWQVSRLLEVTKWVDHTNEVIAQANQFQKLLVDMETGLRGYLVTGNSVFLEPYTQASLLINDALNDFERLTKANQRQQQHLTNLRSDYVQWESYARYMLTLRKRGGDYHTYSINLIGKERMDTMRREIASLIQTEEKLRQARSEAAEQVAHLVLGTSTGLLVLVGSLLAAFTRSQLIAVSQSYRHALQRAQHQAEALRESQQQLQAILDGSTAVIYVKDTQGRYITINRQYETLFHLTKELVKGKTDYDIFPKETADVLRANDQKVLSAGTPLEWEEAVPQNDELHTYLSSKFPLKDHTGVPYAICGISTDISERKQAEEARQKQSEQERTIAQLSKLNTLKDDFLSTVSHELRTPISNIKMALTMLKISLTHIDERSQRYLEILQAECNRESELINELLDLQRLEAGSYSASCVEVVNLQEMLPSIIESFYVRAGQRQQTLQINLPPDLPVLVSDRPSLERILAELLNNACKYTPARGEIVLSVRYSSLPATTSTTTLDSASATIFTISNSAEIPAAYLPHIFEKFYRIPKADLWKQGGTGLGLALVQKLVEQLQGTIQVESSRGWTTFTVCLPNQPKA